MKEKNKKGGFLSMLLGTLGASLLGSMVAGKAVRTGGEGVFRAGEGVTRGGDGVIRADEGVIGAGQDF